MKELQLEDLNSERVSKYSIFIFLEADSQNLRICYTACWGRKSEIREIIYIFLKILFFKFLKMLFFWFFTFSSDPASACCIAYSQILGISLYLHWPQCRNNLMLFPLPSQLPTGKFSIIYGFYTKRICKKLNVKSQIT